jgi:hypothetical protein
VLYTFIMYYKAVVFYTNVTYNLHIVKGCINRTHDSSHVLQTYKVPAFCCGISITHH